MKNKQQESQQHYYDFEYTLKNIPGPRVSVSCGVNEMAGLSDFLSDYSPSMGTIVGMHVCGLSADGWNEGKPHTNSVLQQTVDTVVEEAPGNASGVSR
jgi:hypothetical protein